ncbi:hypothetical protein [Rhodococcus wratislaviensis]|uniref:Uncharacterized protein n=1 Tax=Rhodococcus wratislaviensis NBRC 100605 TaxID=1219028 RepID=X0PL20_RHOWR|nr:hypothetical protein [Rhodococcus wratislaviensis]GAF43023.1 hypothetical protein RW1_005_01310 [Rhodococcus wratislaviensis NBRC 100605]
MLWGDDADAVVDGAHQVNVATDMNTTPRRPQSDPDERTDHAQHRTGADYCSAYNL